jgi:hypothetical protein
MVEHETMWISCLVHVAKTGKALYLGIRPGCRYVMGHKRAELLIGIQQNNVYRILRRVSHTDLFLVRGKRKMPGGTSTAAAWLGKPLPGAVTGFTGWIRYPDLRLDNMSTVLC